MPARGGHIKIKTDEFEKDCRVYMPASPTPSKNPEMSNLQQERTMASKLDMLRHGLIHPDISRRRFDLRCI